MADSIKLSEINGVLRAGNERDWYRVRAGSFKLGPAMTPAALTATPNPQPTTNQETPKMTIRRHTPTKDEQALAAERAALVAELARIDAGLEAEAKKKRDAELAVERAARLATEDRRAQSEASAQLIAQTKFVERLVYAVEHADAGARAEFLDALRQLLAAAQ